MAKPGDIVEFRPGLHGIEAPHNLAILLDRQRRKGVPWVRLVTVEGEKEVKAEHLTKRAFKQRYEGDLRDVAEAKSRLQFLISQHTTGNLAEEAEDDLGALEEMLWEATCDGRTDRDGHSDPDGHSNRDDEAQVWSDEEIAQAHYGETPSPQQLRDVRAALERCRRPGVGRFETAGRGDRWRPWSRRQRDELRKAWNDLNDLRSRLVRAEETDDGRVFHRVGLAEAGLNDDDRLLLTWVRDAMAQFVEHDGVPDGEPVRGIGGLGAVTAFGMDLHRVLGFLAMDWIRSEHTTRSSDYIHFLLESGLWTPDDAVESLMRRHVNQEPFFEHTDDPLAEAAADELPEPRLEDDPGRTDLRHLECYTIDPPDAKDFDDAVGIEAAPDGGTRLWVHIADVSHYVRQGTLLDRHAKKRATSVYLPGRVLPMLPHRIADHLCSLRDDGDRFAVSAALDVAPDGKVTGATFHRALIRVSKNLSYDGALQRAEVGEEPFVSLLALAERMRSHRRGLDLETGEMKVLLEESGFSALEKRANPATRMIETIMVAANVAVATHLSESGTPLLYRCHPLPDAKKAERFSHQLATMGIEADFVLPESTAKQNASEGSGQSLLDALKAGGGKLALFGGGMDLVGGAGAAGDEEVAADPDNAGGDDGPQGFAALSVQEQDAWLAPFRNVVASLSALRDGGLADVATLKLLGCMGRAYYTPQGEGHFGLAESHYCHFTSPIRRYPDLVVHRNLKWLIADRDGPEPHARADLDALCDHCTNQEQAADGLERRIRGAALVLASLTGDTAFSTSAARITGLTPASCFVRLDGGVEARIPARDLPGGPFHVDDWESMLYLSDREAPQRFDAEDLRAFTEWYDEEYGEVRRVRARLGDRVQVRLAGRDVAEGKTGAQMVAWNG